MSRVDSRRPRLSQAGSSTWTAALLSGALAVVSCVGPTGETVLVPRPDALPGADSVELDVRVQVDEICSHSDSATPCLRDELSGSDTLDGSDSVNHPCDSCFHDAADSAPGDDLHDSQGHADSVDSVLPDAGFEGIDGSDGHQSPHADVNDVNQSSDAEAEAEAGGDADAEVEAEPDISIDVGGCMGLDCPGFPPSTCPPLVFVPDEAPICKHTTCSVVTNEKAQEFVELVEPTVQPLPPVESADFEWVYDHDSQAPSYYSDSVKGYFQGSAKYLVPVPGEGWLLGGELSYDGIPNVWYVMLIGSDGSFKWYAERSPQEFGCLVEGGYEKLGGVGTNNGAVELFGIAAPTTPGPEMSSCTCSGSGGHLIARLSPDGQHLTAGQVVTPDSPYGKGRIIRASDGGLLRTAAFACDLKYGCCDNFAFTRYSSDLKVLWRTAIAIPHPPAETYCHVFAPPLAVELANGDWLVRGPQHSGMDAGPTGPADLYGTVDIRLSADGHELWRKASVTALSGMIWQAGLSGLAEAPNGDLGSYGSSSVGQCVVVRNAASGNITWATVVQSLGEGYGWAAGLVALPQGGFVFVTAGGLAVRLTSDGQVVWRRQYPAGIYDIHLLPSAGLLVGLYGIKDVDDDWKIAAIQID